MRSRILTSLAIASLGVGFAACGGDDKSSSGALSKEEFVKQADALCKEYKAKTNGVKQPTDITDAAAAAAYLDEITPIVKEGVAKLKALKPPDDVESDWDAYIVQQETGTKIVEDAADKARAKDPTGLTDLEKLEPNSAKARAAAAKAGAKGCATPSAG